MRTLRRYLVKDMMIFCDRKQLIFREAKTTKTPTQVTLAMIAVARYLGWIKNNENSTNAARIDRAKDGKKFYVAAEEVMELRDEKVKWCRLDRWQLTRAINYSVAQNDFRLIAEGAMNLSELLWVQKLSSIKVLEEEDFYTMNNNLIKFLEAECQTPGTYEFNTNDIIHSANIPITKLLSFYLAKQLGEESMNGMSVSSIVTEEKDNIVISFH